MLASLVPFRHSSPFRLPSFLSGLALMLALASMPVGTRQAQAHAILLDGTPSANTRVAGPNVTFDLRYNSRIDHKRSRLTLRQPDGTKVVLAIKPDSPVDRLQSSKDLPPGAYSLRWQVLATDGHITRGDVPFTVAAEGGGMRSPATADLQQVPAPASTPTTATQAPPTQAPPTQSAATPAPATPATTLAMPAPAKPRP